MMQSIIGLPGNLTSGFPLHLNMPTDLFLVTMDTIVNYAASINDATFPIAP